MNNKLGIGVMMNPKTEKMYEVIRFDFIPIGENVKSISHKEWKGIGKDMMLKCYINTPIGAFKKGECFYITLHQDNFTGEITGDIS